MLKWYEDEKLTIEFDKIPDVGVSYPMPFYGDKKNKEICLYPFINKQPLNVRITWLGEVFTFDIEQGYCWNGADISKLFWRIIGSQFNPEFIVASMLHDFLVVERTVINNKRKLSSQVFRGCLIAAGVGKFKATLMTNCVDIYQNLFCGW